jgi:ATP-dependent exoDNAse (exonuclease V) alpha subunit
MKDSTHWKENDYYKWYYDYSSNDWFSFSKNKEKTKPSERKFLFDLASNYSNKCKEPSIKQLIWAKKIVDKIEIGQNEKKEKIVIRKRNNVKKIITSTRTVDPMHATVRMAWHDNGWNGKVCLSPERNNYCVGDYSLLSSRLKRRKRNEIECKFKCKKPQIELMKGYIPPCYWSINAFGNETIKVQHEHPMSESNYIVDTPNIEETLPPYSVFTWPFKLSFMREKNPLKNEDGNYPKNLIDRINNYFSKLNISDSLIFLYCNYDNPVSADDYKYLLVGCGVLEDKGNLHYYQIPKKNLDKVRQDRGNQNFPTVGWDYRLSLNQNNLVKLPYHEYLRDAEISNDFKMLEEMRAIIDEPELIPSFKYVSMDINDDRAIYLLTKIKKSLLIVKKHHRVNETYDVSKNLQIVELLLENCWKKRGLLPGFKKLNQILLERDDDYHKLEINNYYQKIVQNNPDNYLDILLDLFENNNSKQIDVDERLLCEIDDLKHCLSVKKISSYEYLTLALLNFTKTQFKRILNSNIGETKRSVKEICRNPYLLYEEYKPSTEEDPYLGERIDDEINLFEIDIAFFPDTRYLTRFRKIQKLYPDDPKRLRALTISYLKSLEFIGDCFDIDKNIEKKLKEYPLFYNSDYVLSDSVLSEPADELQDHFEEKLKIIENQDKLYFYLKDLFIKEQNVSTIIKKLMDNSNANLDYEIKLEESVNNLSNNLKDKFDKMQYLSERKFLYPNVFKKKFFVISGSPGCGKSFELLRIVSTLQDNKETCLILTPTGKAAIRLKFNNEGFKNINAITIDKFLFENKDWNNIDIENVIIDEMSMIDLVKFSDFLNKLNFQSVNFKRLILVGDQFQLPPIGFGKVFIDIIRYIQNNEKAKSHYCYLDTNCRQMFDPKIIEFSKIFSDQNKHYEPLIQAVSENTLISDGLKIFYWKTKTQLEKLILKRFEELFQRKLGGRELSVTLNRVFKLNDDGSFNKSYTIDNFQVLSPYRSAFYGTIGLNTFFQKTFRSKTNFIDKRSLCFKNTDKIIQNQNKYNYKTNELILSNGSMGIIDNKGLFYFQEFENNIPQKYLKEEELELAYSITVHKSQGSGFDEVFLIIPPKETLLSRELVYTALTRSKQSLSIFLHGEPTDDVSKNIFERSRRKSKVELRKTSLLDNPYWDYSLNPSDNVLVRSRIEYIIYKKLEELRDEYKDDFPFTFAYEKEYKSKNSSITIKPDFTIKVSSGKTYYWEHLGLTGVSLYVNTWFQRKKIYEKDGILDRLITTDELNGIADNAIEKVIDDIILEELKIVDSKFSNHHYSLR